MAFHLKFVFLFFLIFNHYYDVQALALQNKWASVESASQDFVYQRNMTQLAQETILAEPETTEASLITTTIEPEFEGSETMETTLNGISSPETLHSEYLRKPAGGFEGFIDKLHNHQLNKLDYLKNKFTTTTTISPSIKTTPSVPAVTPSQPVNLPSYTVIKIVKFPCGPFLKCLLQKGKVPTTTTTTVPPTTTTTTRRTTTTTTRRTTPTTRMPNTVGTSRNPVVTTRTTSTQAPIALEAEEVAA